MFSNPRDVSSDEELLGSSSKEAAGDISSSDDLLLDSSPEEAAGAIGEVSHVI